MTPIEHYARAEELLAEGVRVVERIGVLADKREQFERGTPGFDPLKHDRCTTRMDELGKKAMGIWAQAQVHATLANVPLRELT